MSVHACAALVEKGDADRFAAVMAAPVEMRAALWPIFAFNVEVSRAPWVTQEAGIAEIRLQWWRDALEEIRAGGTVRRHEVVEPLAAIADLDVAALDGIAEARRWDIYAEPFEDAGHLTEYLQATSGGLLMAACGAVAKLDVDQRAAVAQAGLASGIANWLMAVPQLEARGRIPLVDGTPDGVRALAQQGLAALAEARAVDLAWFAPVLRTTWRAGTVLRQAEREPALVAQGALGGSEFRRRMSLAWKALRGGW